MFSIESAQRRIAKCAALLLTSLAGAFSTPSFAALAELYGATNVPEEVVFKREPSGAFQNPEVNRYERYAGGQLQRMDFKNPEYAAGNGPVHARNSTEGAKADGTMWMIFKLTTKGYFDSGVANHIAILMHGQLDRSAGQTGGTQTGRGLSLFAPANGGLTVENFGHKTYALADVKDGKLVLRDGTSYWFVVHVSSDGTSYSVYDEKGASLVSGYWKDKNAVSGEGYGFAVLCLDDKNANCDYEWGSRLYDQSFEVKFSNIQIGWF